MNAGKTTDFTDGTDGGAGRATADSAAGAGVDGTYRSYVSYGTYGSTAAGAAGGSAGTPRPTSENGNVLRVRGLMLACATVEDVRGECLREGHPVQAAVLRGRFAGRVVHTNRQGTVFAFCADHPKLTPRVRYRQERAIDELISRDFPRPPAIPRAPGLSDRALGFSLSVEGGREA